MAEIVDMIVTVPGKEDKGYMRRMVKVAELQDAIHADNVARGEGKLSAPTVMKLVEFIADYVTVDGITKRADKIELLLDLSETEYMEIIGSLGVVEIPKES